MLQKTKFSPIQLELLKVYSFEPSEKELKDVKVLLGKYFAEKFITRVNKAAAKKKITQKDLDKWLKDENQ